MKKTSYDDILVSQFFILNSSFPIGFPHLDANLVVDNAGYFREPLDPTGWRDSDQIGDAQLGRREIERANDRAAIAERAGMYRAAQPAPNEWFAAKRPLHRAPRSQPTRG
jgi:hypothetical protein